MILDNKYYLKHEKKEYAEGLTKSKIYMKKSGHYWHLNDNTRGDVINVKYHLLLKSREMEISEVITTIIKLLKKTKK